VETEVDPRGDEALAEIDSGARGGAQVAELRQREFGSDVSIEAVPELGREPDVLVIRADGQVCVGTPSKVL